MSSTRSVIETAIDVIDAYRIGSVEYDSVVDTRDALQALLDGGLKKETAHDIKFAHDIGFSAGVNEGADQMREQCAEYCKPWPVLVAEIRNLPLRGKK